MLNGNAHICDTFGCMHAAYVEVEREFPGGGKTGEFFRKFVYCITCADEQPEIVKLRKEGVFV